MTLSGLLLFISVIGVAQNTVSNTALEEWRAIAEGRKVASDSVKVRILNDLANTYSNQQPDSAILFAKMALEYIGDKPDYHSKIEAYEVLAKSSYIQSNGIAAYDYSLKVIEYAEEIGDKKALLFGKSHLGLAFALQDKISQSIKVFDEFLKLSIELKDSMSIARGYLNQSINYEASKSNDSALFFVNNCIEISETSKNNYYLAMGHNRKGYILSGINRFSEALENHKMALQVMDANNNWERAFAYAGMALAYSGLNDFPNCTYYGEQSLALAKSMNAKWEIKNVAEILANSHYKAGKFKDAFDYYKLFKAYHDSIFSEENAQKLSALELKQAQMERDALLHENELKTEILSQRELQLMLFAVILVILTLLLMVMYYLYRSRKQYAKKLALQHDKLDELNRSKDKILSVLAHDIRSPVNSILNLLHLMKYEKDENINLDEFIDGVYERTVTLSSSLEGILTWSVSQFQNTEINPKAFAIAPLVAEYIKLFQYEASRKSIQLIHDQNHACEVMAESEHVKAIIRNLLANAIKFTPTGGKIAIRYRNLNNQLAVEVADSGVGISDERKERIFKSKGETTLGTNQEIGTGLGLFICNEFAEMNGGRMEVTDTPGGGATFSLILKKA